MEVNKVGLKISWILEDRKTSFILEDILNTGRYHTGRHLIY